MSKKTIWTIVALVGGYVICQAIADIAATKMIDFFGFVIPAGTFVFTVTFTLRDMLHKRLGKEWARAAIILAGVFNLLMAGYLALMATLPAPAFYTLGDAWNTIFIFVPAITIGSIIAEVMSEWVDTEIYHLWTSRVKQAPQWTRVVVSNVVSLPLDSFLFAMLAFVLLPPLFGAQALPVSVALSAVVGQIVWKAVITIFSIPGIYLVKDQKIFAPGD